MAEFKQYFLDRAIELSKEHMMKDDGGPFGAIIVKDDKIIGEGWNCVTSHNDPTAHAEVQAIRKACGEISSFQLSNCEIYTSCEPCPMCLASIYWARLDRIFYANTRTQAASIGFDDEFIYEEIAKSISERSIPTIHHPSEKAQQVFEEWNTKLDKIKY